MVDSLPPSNDPRLIEAIRRRDAALKEAAGWEDFIQRYTLLAAGTATDSRQPAKAPTKAARSAGPKKSPFGGYKTPKSKEVVKMLEAVRSIIQDRGYPVGTGELFLEVLKRGVPIGGKSPRSNFDGRLRYNSGFVNIKGRGWWPDGQALPAPNGSAAGTHGIPAAQEDQASSNLA